MQQHWCCLERGTANIQGRIRFFWNVFSVFSEAVLQAGHGFNPRLFHQLLGKNWQELCPSSRCSFEEILFSLSAVSLCISVPPVFSSCLVWSQFIGFFLGAEISGQAYGSGQLNQYILSPLGHDYCFFLKLAMVLYVWPVLLGEFVCWGFLLVGFVLDCFLSCSFGVGLVLFFFFNMPRLLIHV